MNVLYYTLLLVSVQYTGIYSEFILTFTNIYQWPIRPHIEVSFSTRPVFYYFQNNYFIKESVLFIKRHKFLRFVPLEINYN